MQSFAEFAAAKKLRPKIGCAVCSLGPNACDEIASAWAAGYRSVTIAAWLNENFGANITEPLVRRHMRQEHTCKASPITSKPKSKKK